jgi:glycosyltransferase involved in cell wall biosynthesis
MKWGRLKPSNLLHTYADDVGAIVVPSRRLLEMFRAVDPGDRGDLPPRQFMLAQKGFDPDAFFDQGARTGPELVTGWAGAIESLDKHVGDLLAADPRMWLAVGTSARAIAIMEEMIEHNTMSFPRSLSYDEMPGFYNGIDVIAIASDAEGDPRPLIEGMACGCFPVTTDVGIAPELVRHLDNGYIIQTDKRGPEAFAEAFEWCRANLSYVRAAGRANAEWMSNVRTWEAVMPTWDAALVAAIERGATGIGPPGPFSLLDPERADELA